MCQADLEDEILQLLSSATGSLLDNIQLINTLDASKTTWEQVNQSLQVLLPCLLHTLCGSHTHHKLLAGSTLRVTCLSSALLPAAMHVLYRSLLLPSKLCLIVLGKNGWLAAGWPLFCSRTLRCQGCTAAAKLTLSLVSSPPLHKCNNLTNLLATDRWQRRLPSR